MISKHALKLSLYKALLLIYLALFIAYLLIAQLRQVRLQLILFGVLIIITNIYFLQNLPVEKFSNSSTTNQAIQQNQEANQVAPSLFSLKNNEDFSNKELTKSEVENELEEWLKIEELQPTHRDILLTISLLYQALGQEKEADIYWQRAYDLDPTFSAFNE